MTIFNNHQDLINNHSNKGTSLKLIHPYRFLSETCLYREIVLSFALVKPITLVVKQVFFTLFVFIAFGLCAQNNPVAIDDSAQIMNQKVLVIPVLENDYDPDGDPIIISMAYSANHGEEWNDDTLVYYKSEWHDGWDEITYRIEKKNNPSFESEKAYIHIEVIENPDVPLAVNDTFTIKRLELADLNLLINDSDPNGDDLKINELWFNQNLLEVIHSSDSSYATVTSNHSTPEEYTFKYDGVELDMQEPYFSNQARVHLIIEDNPDIPTAVYDTFQMTGGIPAYLDVLQNDLDPLGDTIEIFDYASSNIVSVSLIDNIFYVIIDTSFSGSTHFTYTWRYKNNPWLYTEQAVAYMTVAKNPDCPVGVVDYGSGMAFMPISIDVLQNDYDPNDDPIEIMDVQTISMFSTASIEGNQVIYTSNAFTIGKDSLQYRIRQSNDHNYYSGWIKIYLEIEHNPEFPLTLPDTASTKSGIPITIDVIQNDIFPDTGSFHLGTIHPIPNLGRATSENNMITYKPFMSSAGVDSFSYILRRDTFPIFFARGTVYVNVDNNYCYDSLTINNVNAGFHSSGYQFSAGDEIFGEAIYNYGPHYEIPKGSGKHTIFTHNLWLGGLDENDSLHLAGERYKQAGNDFQPGPVSNAYNSLYKDQWYSLWMLYKEEVEYHINNWWKEGYAPIRSIADWPGNGNTANGQAEQLAPFFDHDGNVFYDPMQGDYPLMRGDQCVYFIYNDDLEHTETAGKRIGIEIHGMAYAFDEPEDSIINNTVFVHYDLINRSEHTYDDFYFGVFADVDLGYSWDDYIASYVKGSSFYVYNGRDTDGNGEPGTYGEYPPAQSVTILAGPFMDPDQEDNPDGNCDYGVTGTNFGNGIIDDERFGLTRFTYFNNSAGPQGDPNIASEYYNYLLGLWKDDTPVLFGGNGHSSSGADASPCRYMFPGNSDPRNWGTDCELPLGGYNQNDLWWTEEQAGNNPFDRRGFGVSGPFTFLPGQIQEVEIAYIFANSYYSADSSRSLLLSYIDNLRSKVQNGEIIIPNNELAINEGTAEQVSITIYPNPARDLIHIESQDNIYDTEYRIYNSMGTAMQTGKLTSEINITGLKAGLYIITLITPNGTIANKFIKY